MNKKCRYCQKEFSAVPRNKVFCHKTCKDAEYRLLYEQKYNAHKQAVDLDGMLKTCEVCLKQFRTDRDEARFCDRKCAGIGKYKPQAVEREIRQCELCGDDFKVRMTQKSRFCGLKCVGKAKTIRSTKTKQCPNCKQSFETKRDNAFCSRHCAKSGEFHPYYGKIGPTAGMASWTKGLTKETDERVCGMANTMSKLTKEAFATGQRSHVGENNPMHGQNHSIATRERISKTRTERILDGDYASWFKKGTFESKKCKKSMHYRSSWELIALQALERTPSVSSFDVEPFSIPYLFEGCVKNYIPDILIHKGNQQSLLVEIKPEEFVQDPINIAKFTAAVEYCRIHNYRFEVWSKDEINRLHILCHNSNEAVC